MAEHKLNSYSVVKGTTMSVTPIAADDIYRERDTHMYLWAEEYSGTSMLFLVNYENPLKLIIYPNGDNIVGKDSGYVSVYLAIADTSSLPTNWEVNVVFNIFLFNQISANYLCSLGRTRCFQPMKSEWGFSKFISKKIMSEPSNGYLVDDNCVFGVEVFLVKREADVTQCYYLRDFGIPFKLTDKLFTATSTSKGRPIFMEIETMNDPNNGFIVDDTCLLHVEISSVEDVAQ
ncbi:hypothetical protein MIMGU_mgv1a024200mg [Erythranthe guttata]|uniref:MATH domain-containing protein n=1 Tax=Erythranthe guttata TaxID=4155 RepID=A0A022RKS4_ERYGU|nr:hypothetical protein MIMGU_mgv1a024200mg [Erythranthe guttata]